MDQVDTRPRKTRTSWMHSWGARDPSTVKDKNIPSYCDTCREHFIAQTDGGNMTLHKRLNKAKMMSGGSVPEHLFNDAYWDWHRDGHEEGNTGALLPHRTQASP